MATQLYNYRIDELERWLAEQGQPRFRAKQLYAWMYQKRVLSYEEMTDLPASFRAMLAEGVHLATMQEVTRQVSQRDGTTKFLFRLHDGSTIESVLMRHDYGNSVCVSTQAGCKMGCTFCASTLGGLVRNLTAGEIVEQLLACQRLLDAEGERVSSVVLMGSGEPLDNYDASMRFIDIINDPNGLHIGQRHITISTVGLVPGIRKFADEALQVTLAVSLHAPNDAIRSSMMPVNKAYPIEKLIDACRYYITKTGKRISFEYALVGGVNDRLSHARELAELIGDLPCHVNLIPVNYVPERNLKRTTVDTVRAFREELTRLGVNATVRREMGSDIAAACGQLRAEHQGRD